MLSDCYGDSFGYRGTLRFAVTRATCQLRVTITPVEGLD